MEGAVFGPAIRERIDPESPPTGFRAAFISTERADHTGRVGNPGKWSGTLGSQVWVSGKRRWLTLYVTQFS